MFFSMSFWDLIVNSLIDKDLVEKKKKEINYFCYWQLIFFQISQLVPTYSVELDHNDCAVKPQSMLPT